MSETYEKNATSDPAETLTASMIDCIFEESASLLDLGCGTAGSKEMLLSATPEYWGVDYVGEGNRAIIDEYNSGDFPFQEADTVFCSGCLEYIRDVDGFVKKMCACSRNEVILSYDFSDGQDRRLPERKNDLTEEAIQRIFRLYGFVLHQAKKAGGNTKILKLVNERKLMIRLVQWKKLTYLEETALSDLMETVVRTNDLPGCMIEAGCALGGSGICMAREKKDGRSLFVYDVFGMIPEPGERDDADVRKRYDVIKDGKALGIRGDTYYGYREHLLEEVKNSFCELLGIPDVEEKGIRLIKGLFEDTLIVDGPVSLAHIDCDWYDSVMVCLERIVPRLVPGGVLVIDDYDHWSGCRKAVDDYFRDKTDGYVFEKKSRMHITRKGASCPTEK